MTKIIDYFLAQIKAKKQKNYKLFLDKGLTWKTLNPKLLKEYKTEN